MEWMRSTIELGNNDSNDDDNNNSKDRNDHSNDNNGSNINDSDNRFGRYFLGTHDQYQVLANSLHPIENLSLQERYAISMAPVNSR